MGGGKVCLLGGKNYHMTRLSIRQELKKVLNRTFLRELQNRLQEKKIKERELAKILSELIFNQSEQELTAAYEEWANDPDEQAEIKEWKTTEKDHWDN